MHTDVLRTSPFRYEHRRTLWGRARLYRDRLVFDSVHGTGVRRRVIRLEAVAAVTWLDGRRPGQANFVLTLHDGETVSLWIKSAGLWKVDVEALAPDLRSDVRLPSSAEAPPVTSSAA